MENLNSIQSPKPFLPSVEKGTQQPVEPQQNGNGFIFEDLVSEHRERVMRHCSRRGLDYDDAADVTQEIFIKVMRNLDKFENRYPITTWLYRITENAVTDHLRRRSRRMASFVGSRMEDGREMEFPSNEYDPEDIHRISELQKNIASALEQLSEPMRQVLEMKEFEGLTYAKIAERLQCPRETVKSRLHRARKHLIKQMAHLR